MGIKTDSERPQRRRVDAAAKAGFVAALRAGMARDAAARLAGFTSEAFYYWRERDPVFRLAWLYALELSAIDARAAFAVHRAAPDDMVIAPNRNRRLQHRPMRRRRFDDRRKRIFLDHFAGTADAHAAAAAAGVGYSTVTQHRLKHAEFAAAWDEALAHAYALLEAEVVRQRLEAQQQLREGLCPTGEIAREFDRVMQLLARYARRDGRVGLRARGPGQLKRWTFEDAIDSLDKKLRALGARRILLPPPQDEAGERETR